MKIIKNIAKLAAVVICLFGFGGAFAQDLIIKPGLVIEMRPKTAQEKEYDRRMSLPDDMLSQEERDFKQKLTYFIHDNSVIVDGMQKLNLTEQDFIKNGIPVYYYLQTVLVWEWMNYSLIVNGMSKNRMTEMYEDGAMRYKHDRLGTKGQYVSKMEPKEMEYGDRMYRLMILMGDYSYVENGLLKTKMTEQDVVKAGVPAHYYKDILKFIHLTNLNNIREGISNEALVENYKEQAEFGRRNLRRAANGYIDDEVCTCGEEH